MPKSRKSAIGHSRRRVDHLSVAEAKCLLRAVRAYSSKQERLSQFFPELTLCLKGVARFAGCDLAEIASQHVLSAEALIEVSQGAEKEASAETCRDRLHDAFVKRTSQKLLTFFRRPEEEKVKIVAAYPEISLDLIALALERHLLDHASVLDVLTDISEYQALVHLLGRHGVRYSTFAGGEPISAD